jgi:hypothetical protein
VFLLALGAALAHYALGHHILKTERGHISVPKAQMTLSHTYADITDWEREDFEQNPKITRALLEHGHEELVPVTSSERIKDWLRQKAGDLLD